MTISLLLLAATKVALPSAADLFDSVGTSSFVSPAEVDDAEVSPSLHKRKTGGSLEGKGSGESKDKKSKPGAKNEPPLAFVPPQMSRPNVVTEDATLWSTNASLKRQKQAAGGKAKSGAEGKKDSLTYKQREKVKHPASPRGCRYTIRCRTDYCGWTGLPGCSW